MSDNLPYAFWATRPRCAYYASIIQLLRGENNIITTEDAIRFLEHELQKLEQKNDMKKEAHAKKRAKEKEEILSVMKDITKPSTCSKIQSYIPYLSISKISFLLNSMAGVEVIKSRRMRDGRALFMYNC